MALWKVDVEKFMLNEYWTNRYIVDAASLATASAVADEIYAAERQVHQNLVLFTKVRTSNVDPTTDVYAIAQKNTLGLKVTGSEWLPLFNVVRVDFTTVGGGRPSRKYLRLPLEEPEVSNGALTTAMITFMLTNYVTPMLAIPEFVDVDQQAFSDGSVSVNVAMRQLRRGSKRKTTPIL